MTIKSLLRRFFHRSPKQELETRRMESTVKEANIRTNTGRYINLSTDVHEIDRERGEHWHGE